jgi:polyhydroxyalkanoate synthesis regulator phasin
MAAIRAQLSDETAPMVALRTQLGDQAKILASILILVTNLPNVAEASTGATHTRLDNLEKQLANLSEIKTNMPTGATTNRDEEVNSLTAENEALKTQISALEQKLDARRERESNISDLQYELAAKLAAGSSPSTPAKLRTMESSAGPIATQGSSTSVDKGSDTDAPLTPTKHTLLSTIPEVMSAPQVASKSRSSDVFGPEHDEQTERVVEQGDPFQRPVSSSPMSVSQLFNFPPMFCPSPSFRSPQLHLHRSSVLRFFDLLMFFSYHRKAEARRAVWPGSVTRFHSSTD